jgi:hypothetical protein
MGRRDMALEFPRLSADRCGERTGEGIRLKA